MTKYEYKKFQIQIGKTIDGIGPQIRQLLKLTPKANKIRICEL